jgi:hypothetical protein
VIRIANGQGFWGDWLEAPVRLVEQGPIDYLALDYLAEVTMSILQNSAGRPQVRHARDFAADRAHRPADPRARRESDRQRRRRQPCGCAAKGAVGARPEGSGGIGDDVFAWMVVAKGYEMRDMDTGEPSPPFAIASSAPTPIWRLPLAEALPRAPMW